MPVFRIIARAKYFNQVCENVLHFYSNGNETLDQCVNIIQTVWFPTIRSFQNAGLKWFQIAGQNVSAPPGPLQIYNFPEQAGSYSGKGAHPSLCVLFSLRAGCAGRTCRGRIYIPGVHEEGVLNGQVEPNYQVTITNFANLMVQRFTIGGNDFRGFALVIAPRNNPGNFKEVTQIIPRFTFGIQRRRNIGVGS